MGKYKIILNGEEFDEIFDSNEEAEEEAQYYYSCDKLGAEILNMSNPGDYDYDEETYEYPKYEIIEVDE